MEKEATSFIKKIGESNGWKVDPIGTAGKLEGYSYSVLQPNEVSPIILSSSFTDLSPTTQESLTTAIESIKSNYQIAKFNIFDKVIMLNITPTSSSNDDVESLNTLLGVLSKLFARFELVNGKVSTSKPNQIKSYQNNPGMSTMKIKPYGSYVSGAVGSLLGAMIGSGLWLLVSFLGFYVAIVGFVMSIISEAGYRLFRGRFGIGMPIIIILSVIFGVFFANTIEIAIRLSQATGISFVNALYYAPQAFYNNQLFLVDKVWLNLGIGLVFALLGSWRIIKKLKSEISYKMDKKKS